MTIQQIIEDAYTESNITALGQALQTYELENGLRRLQRIVDSWYGTVCGEYYYDWYFPPLPNSPDLSQNPRDVYGRDKVNPAYPSINVRVVLNLTAPSVLYFPKYPNDGSRMSISNVGDATQAFSINPNGHKIEGSLNAATINLEQVPTAQWFFRADLQDWVRIAPLTLAGQSQFPEQFDDLLVTALARRLSVSNGQPLSPVIEDTYSKQMQVFRARYKQLTPTEAIGDISAIQSFGVDGRYGSVGDSF